MAASLAFASAISSCSLGNVRHDDCVNNAECEKSFGLGSQCQLGYCTTPPSCETQKDCADLFGGGACVNKVCSSDCDSTRADGIPCNACPPTKPVDVLNTCTDAECAPFDNARVTKLVDGELPPLPAPPVP